MTTEQITKLSIFEGKQIRRVLLEGKWWFSVIDVIAFLTDSKKPRDYWHKMKIREKSTADVELSTICRQLKLKSSENFLLKNKKRVIKNIPTE